MRAKNFRTYYRSKWLGFPPKATKETLAVTHFPMFDVKAADLDAVFYSMQGEIWSPHGEGRPIVDAALVGHTSMSVGDVIEDLETGKLYQIEPVGFAEVN